MSEVNSSNVQETKLATQSLRNPASENLPAEREESKQSNYDGFGDHDSTTTGGFGRNAGGSAFSRANQMGTASGGDGNDDDDSYAQERTGSGGDKTGASTPGYRRDGEEESSNQNNQFRGQNLSFTSGTNNDDPEI
ncbi:uncharacterized protein EHS24_004277 [Apiotrichum porosum]|uniref:Uncharacterized protein n=1 Tax=Apiotrichum porosum TaxID=105984 RepID=A0A427Y4R5_9TREE|nr:uncharacterized protein EHS24_004277 [Apiotrichum porosum]RSH86067.1 hypothetical protein EHS24_004277 [Apiotrichum porosum]